MTEGTPVDFKTVRVSNLEGSPNGLYVYAPDMLHMMAVIGMAKQVDLSKEIRELKALMS